MNQVICIIGALSESGKKLVKHYSSAGAKLILIDENRDDLYRLKQENNGNPMHSHVLASSLSNPEALKSTLAQALKIFDRIDLLYWTTCDIASGIQSTNGRAKSSMDRNFWSFVSLYLLVQSPEMSLKPEHVIVLSDASSLIAPGGNELETASKHALRAYVNSLKTAVSNAVQLSFVVTTPAFNVSQLEKSLKKTEREILFPGVLTVRLRLLRRLAFQFEKALQNFIH